MRQASCAGFKSAITIVTILLTITLALSGCARRLGYGVLLWSEDETVVPSGSLVSVVKESNLQDTYEIRADAGSDELTIPRWRVRFFETEEEATAAVADYSDLAPVYARAGRNALPMRTAPELKNDNIVYRLREGETVKLIGRSAEQADLSGLVSYWYTALTTTGVEAYVFGYELRLFNPLDPTAEFAESGTADPLMELLLDNVWRPIYFVDMITNGTYDLELFQPEYGLFPSPDDLKLELVMPYHTVTFQYDEIVNVGPRKYLAEGTNLQLSFNRGDELSIQYVIDGRQYILALQRISGEVQDYVDAELARREEVFAELLERGPAFSSGSYGNITLLEDGQFIWSGYERLVPAAIPSGLGTGGTIALDLYVGPDMADDYDGAISFRFKGNPAAVSFVYKLVPDGIRMVFVPQSDIDEYVVTGSGVSSITLFFSAVGG